MELYTTSNRAGTTVLDYTTNLIYKTDFNNIKNGENGVSFIGNGINISNNKKYVSFDGASYISIDHNNIDLEKKTIGTTDKTLCCWFKTTSVLNNENVLMSYGMNYADLARDIQFSMIRSNKTIYGGSGYATCDKTIDPQNLLDGNWHFFVSQFYNGNSVRIYYDNVPFGNTGSYSTADTYLNIGGISNTRYFNGDISDVRIYSSTLSADAINQLYEYGKQNLDINT